MGSLHNCLNEKRYHQFIYLVNLKSNLNELDEKLNTPLVKICSTIDNIQIAAKLMKVLLANGANTDVEDEEGLSPLHIACKRNIPELARLLLRQIPDCPVNVTDMYGNTPLHYAASHKETTLVSLLLPRLIRYKVNTDRRNKLGFTPLLIAASNGRLEVARFIAQNVQASKVIYDSLYFLTVDQWFRIYFDWSDSESILNPSTAVYDKHNEDIKVEKENLVPVVTRPAVNQLLETFSRENSASLCKNSSKSYTQYSSKFAPIKCTVRPKTAPLKEVNKNSKNSINKIHRCSTSMFSCPSGAASQRQSTRNSKITLDVHKREDGWTHSRSGPQSDDAFSNGTKHSKAQESYWGSMVELADICSQQLSESYRKTIIPTWPEVEPVEEPVLMGNIPPKQTKDKQGSRTLSVVMSVMSNTKGRRLGSESSVSMLDDDQTTPKGSIKAKLLKFRKNVSDRKEDEDRNNDDSEESEQIEKAAAMLNRALQNKRKSQTKMPSINSQSSVVSSGS